MDGPFALARPREVGLVLTMNYYILKFTLAVRAWNDRNFNNSIDFLWNGLRRRLVSDRATRGEVRFGRLLAGWSYSLRSGTAFGISSFRL